MKGKGPAVLMLISTLLLASAPRSAGRQQTDVEALVSAARQALGGATLDSVVSFTLSGSFTRSLPGGPAISTSFESSCVLPDKFIRIGRRWMDGPVSFSVTNYDGFNGDAAIDAIVAPDAPMPMTLPGPVPTTAQEIEAARQKRLDRERRIYLETAIPLFVTVPSFYGLQLSAAGKVALDKGQADVVDMRRADGASWRLLLDESTHLPARLMWRAKPIVTTSVSSVVSSRGDRTSMSPLPSGDPTVGLQDVEWAMTIRDYKLANGLNWPRRLTTTVGGRTWEDVRIAKFAINPKIDPKLFEPRTGKGP